jgi:hypothetical protein
MRTSECIGEAMAIAGNQLLLHDPGRPEKWVNEEKQARALLKV